MFPLTIVVLSNGIYIVFSASVKVGKKGEMRNFTSWLGEFIYKFLTHLIDFRCAPPRPPAVRKIRYADFPY